MGEIKEFFVPNPFKEDTWVTSNEIRPGDPSVVHHVIVQIPDQTARPEVGFIVKKCNNCGPLVDVQTQVAVLKDQEVALKERLAVFTAISDGFPGHGRYLFR